MRFEVNLPPDAFGYFEKAIKLDNMCDRLFANLGVAQLLKGDDKEALSSLNEVPQAEAFLMESGNSIEQQRSRLLCYSWFYL